MAAEIRNPREFRKRPVIEIVDIRVDGSTPVEISLKQSFVKVSRLIAFYEWTALSINYTEFAGSAALTNGLQIVVDKTPLLPLTIKALHGHMRYAYDTTSFLDTAVVKNAQFASRLSFHKFMGNEEGIDLTEYGLKVVVSDDLSGIGNQLNWVFEGWAWDR